MKVASLRLASLSAVLQLPAPEPVVRPTRRRPTFRGTTFKPRWTIAKSAMVRRGKVSLHITRSHGSRDNNPST